MTRYWAVVPAAGAGKRMGSTVPKQYLQILGQPILQHTLTRLLEAEMLAGIMVALGHEDGYWHDQIPARHDPRIMTTTGGAERTDSVLCALEALSPLAHENDWVLVHDAARLCITVDDIRRLITMVTTHASAPGGILAVPVSDTLKQVGDDLTIADTPDRSHIWRAFTPQMFRIGALKKVLLSARQEGYVVTDDASAFELAGERPLIVEGRPDNIKVTRPEDLALAAFYLEQQCIV